MNRLCTAGCTATLIALCACAPAAIERPTHDPMTDPAVAATPSGVPTETGYRVPPDPIRQILDTPPTPSVSVAPDRERILLIGRPNLRPIADLAQPELRLAGMRVNPRTNGPSRASYANALSVRDIGDGSELEIELPEDPRLNYMRWSPDGERLAFTHTTDAGYELWVADARTGQTQRVVGPELNAAIPGVPYDWMPDGDHLVVARVVSDRGEAPPPPTAPHGPVIQEGEGPATPGRTYQDLLQNSHDEALFEYYFSAQPGIVAADGGEVRDIGAAGLLRAFDPAPGGEYLLVSTMKRPFSYTFPWSRFPYEVNVLDLEGRTVRQIVDLPLADEVPVAFDAVPEGPRSVQWRADAPATLMWVEAQDGGDPRSEAEVRDRLIILEAPFRDRGRRWLEMEHRYAGVTWGRGDAALVYSRWWNERNQRIYRVRPDDLESEPELLVDRSWEDRYADPGSPLTTRNEAGHMVLQFSADGDHIFLTGQGASPEGDRPFIDRFSLSTGEAERLWRSESPTLEQVVTVLDDDAHVIITRRQSPDDPPNFFTRDLVDGTFEPITGFEDPAPQLAGIGREIISYQRADGVTLSGTLYTPPGYDPAEDGPLPTLLWAYPREFRDADAAGQMSGSPYQFVRPGGSSHLFLLTQGYAILDGPAMPVIGEGEAEPNDTFVEQLVMGAEAAIDRLVEIGVSERGRIAIGGHSYGAFMAANLLAHSDLFAAGIARSGAYNRTFTPFGFQAEQRTFWEARDTYMRMSPFSYAHRIEAPILLIHGDSDNNSGTFPVQSERFYHALRGNGATVRLVMLPHEGHGYSARESVLHVLAEQIDWLDRYLKDARD